MTDTTALQEPASSVQASAQAALDEALAKSLHMAVQFHEAGDVGSAETLYRGILEAQPDHPEANSLLGRLALQVGQLQGALPYLAAALQARPDQEHYWVDYLDALIQADELATVRRLLTLAGKQEDLRGGQALEAVAGRLEERARAKMAPPRRELDRLLACFGQGRLAEAEELARSLTERFPGHGLAWKILGVARSKRLGPETSIEPLRKAVEVWPDDAEAHVNLAISYEGLDRVSEAEACYQRALELNPAQARACNNLGVIWKEQGRTEEAEALFRRAVKARPNMPDAYNNLGILQKTVGQLADAEASYRRALKVAPNMAAAHTNLGVLLYDQYRAAEGEASLRRALTLLPPEQVLEGGRAARLRAAMHGNLLFYLTLHQTQSPDQLFAEHRRFAERFEAPLRPLRREHANSRDPERVLQVGLVSNDLYNHAVASFLEPVLARLVGNTRLSLHAYSNNATEDFVTARLRTLVPHWYRVGRVGDAALADQIRADGIDILIDLSGHTENSRMLCFARKPAPVQVSWMGYPGTTGLESVDYYLADRFIVPPGSLDDQFSEKLVYLPANAPFQPSDGAVGGQRAARAVQRPCDLRQLQPAQQAQSCRDRAVGAVAARRTGRPHGAGRHAEGQRLRRTGRLVRRGRHRARPAGFPSALRHARLPGAAPPGRFLPGHLSLRGGHDDAPRAVDGRAHADAGRVDHGGARGRRHPRACGAGSVRRGESGRLRGARRCLVEPAVRTGAAARRHARAVHAQRDRAAGARGRGPGERAAHHVAALVCGPAAGILRSAPAEGFQPFLRGPAVTQAAQASPVYVTRPHLPPLEEFIPYLEKIWDSKILTNGGPFHQQLEQALCEYLGVEHLALFTNGTIALVTALQALRITGEVITTPYSFVATAHSLLWNGIKPVFVDIDPTRLNLDPAKIEAAITPQTTAIMPVHCYGHPCDVDAIQKIADNYNLQGHLRRRPRLRRATTRAAACCGTATCRC